MTFRPVNPYDLLVQQLLENVGRTTEATERGLMAQREERLIGEERDFQQGLIEQQRAWQQSDYAQQRRDRLTEQSMSARAAQLAHYQNLIGFVTPDHPEYAAHQAALTALAAPLGLEGEEAWELVNSGRLAFEVDGVSREAVVYALMGEAGRLAEQTKLQDEWDAGMTTRAIENAMNVDLDMQVRLDWANGLLRNPEVRQSLKDRLIDMLVEDPEARDRVRDEQRLRELDLQRAELEVMTMSVSLGQEIEKHGWARDWHTWEYDKAQQQWEMDVARHRQEMVVSDREAFLEAGFLPPEERRAELAQRLGYPNVEALEEAGRERYGAFQEDQRQASRALRLSNDLTGKQIQLADLTAAREALSLNRDRIYGVLQDQLNIEEYAMAAAVDGHVQTIDALIALRDTGNYDDALGGLQLESLRDMALERFERSEHAAQHARRQLELSTAVMERDGVLDVDAFIDSVAVNFQHEDFSLAEDGSRPALEAAVRAWVDTLSPAAVRDATGGTPEQLVQRLLRAAVIQDDARGRSEAASKLAVLLEAPWPENSAAQARHRAAILDLARQTGVWDDDELATVIDGLADEARRDVLKSDMELREGNQRADLMYAQTLAQFYEVLRTGIGGPAGIDLDALSDMHGMAMAQADRAIALMNGAMCGITVDESNFVMAGETFNSDNPDCVEGFAKWERWYNIGEWLASAAFGGDGLAYLDPSGMPAQVPGAPQVMAQADGSMAAPGVQQLQTELVRAYGSGADQFDRHNFYALPVEMQALALQAVQNGTPAAEVNEVMMEALVALDAQGGFIAPPQGLPSITDVKARVKAAEARSGQARDFEDLPFEEKLAHLEQSQEWMALATDVANRQTQMTPERLAADARRFGFEVPRNLVGLVGEGFRAGWQQFLDAVAGREVGEHFSYDAVDVSEFQRALNATIDNKLKPPHERRLRQNAEWVMSFDPLTGQPQGPERGPFPRPPLNIVRPQAPAGEELPLGDASGPFPPGFMEGLAQLQSVPGLQPASARGSGINPGELPGAAPASELRTSPQGLQNIRNHEGFRQEAYQDAGGVWTVGYGQTGAGVGPGTTVSPEQAEEMLRNHMRGVERAIIESVQVPLTQGQFDALASLVYNIGEGAFRGSDLLRHLNNGDVQAAANEFLRWNRADGQVLPGLTARRQQERALFLGGL